MTQGRQTREFNYVEDLAEGFVLLATTPDIEGELFNLGTGEEVSIRELASLILKLMGDPIQPEFGALPERPTEIPRMYSDSTKAQYAAGLETGAVSRSRPAGNDRLVSDGGRQPGITVLPVKYLAAGPRSVLLFKQAYTEEALECPEVDERTQKVAVLYPRSFVESVNDMPGERIHDYCFMGSLYRPEIYAHREWILDFATTAVHRSVLHADQRSRARASAARTVRPHG